MRTDPTPEPHPHPHHAAALATGAVALTTALLTTGCDGMSASAAADGAAFSTVSFALGARGDVQLSGGSSAAVEPAGSYSVTAGRAHRFDRPGDRLLVVLRHWPASRTERASRGRVPRTWPPAEAAVETGFLVDTASWVRADLDGHALRWLRRDTIRIDATNATAVDVTQLTLSGPHGGRSGRPVPPPATRACAHLDGETPRRAVLPDVEEGTDVPDALARLNGLCLDVQYATRPGAGRPGTVRQVLVPLAGRPVASAVLPADGGAVPGRGPGDRVLFDPSRPATVVVTR
ncbi:hypothetical protein [Streptomyces sp. NBC_00005]|uniref:hypothetical protein n=1 Tax=Streptomyces sp. NBC_00005 TaxID=2903609 RepID=UPI00324D3228